MKLNITLMGAGLGLLAAALYRMGAIKIDRKFFVDILPLMVGTVIIGIVVYHLGGMKMINEAAGKSAKMIAGYAPMLTIMFIAMGGATVIVEMYRAPLVAYLGGRSGVFGSLVSAYLMPGSLTSMPILRTLWDGGTNRIPLVVFLLTTRLVGWQVMLVLQPILGWRITAIQFCLGTVVAFAIAAVGWVAMAV
jgi:uncharacterized membrane protein YraQ (UPF0718 family)